MPGALWLYPRPLFDAGLAEMPLTCLFEPGIRCELDRIRLSTFSHAELRGTQAAADVPGGVEHGFEARPVIIVDKQPEPVLGRNHDLHHQQRVDAEIGEGRSRCYIRPADTCYGAKNLGDASKHFLLVHQCASCRDCCRLPGPARAAPDPCNACCTSYSWIHPKSRGTAAIFWLRACAAGPSGRWSKELVTQELRWILRVRARRSAW